MRFSFSLPTRVVYGPEALQREPEALSGLGRNALVVAGRGSYRHNGAWEDLAAVLGRQGIEARLFPGVEPNPSLETVDAGRRAGLEMGADCVIGLGGGSALDAAKAVAALIAHPELRPEDLYQRAWQTALPLAAIPTTAGTGSEVTPYAVLTLHHRQFKRTLVSPALVPRLAYVDPRYTYGLPAAITLPTGLDAWSHLVEGYLCARANSVSDSWAEKGLAIFGRIRKGLQEQSWDEAWREHMMRVSLLGGLVIALTGTATVHALGFPLTYFKQTPHGLANGSLLAGHLRRCAGVAPGRTEAVCRLTGFDSLEQLTHWLSSLLPPAPRLSSEEIAAFAGQALTSKNHENNLYPVTLDTLCNLLEESQDERGGQNPSPRETPKFMTKPV